MWICNKSSHLQIEDIAQNNYCRTVCKGVRFGVVIVEETNTFLPSTATLRKAARGARVGPVMKENKGFTMFNSKERVHICFGELEKDFEKLKSAALLPRGQVFDWWNITHSARPGDLVIFYIIAPIKVFLATARIASICDECPDKTSKWKDKTCAWLRDAQMLPQAKTRDEVRESFPEWQYLNRPTATCIPNDTTPPNLVDRFLEFLGVGNPLTAHFAEASDIEGLMAEVSSFTQTRSRRLRNLALNEPIYSSINNGGY